MKNKGFTLVETIVAASLGLALIGSATYGFNQYTERKDKQDRVATTAHQLASFSEATYQYASSVGDLSQSIITTQELKDKNIISDGFSSITPYGQEIKAFVVENPSENYFDILVTTTGEPEDNFLDRSGKTQSTFPRIQEEIYQDVRRIELEVDGREYYAGMIKEDQFFTSGNLHERDVSPFSAEVNTEVQQPTILLVAPEKTPDNIQQVQAIHANPSVDVPANGTSSSIIRAGIRFQDGTPVVGEEIVWSTSKGDLSSNESITDSDGVAEVELTHTVAERATVTATYNGDSKSATVDFAGAQVASISATPNSNVNADGTMCSMVTSQLAYPDGTPAINEIIQWQSSLGSYKNSVNQSDASGRVTACLISNSEGTAIARTLIPRFNNDNSVSITFIGPRIQSGNISANPSSNLRDDGSHYSTITVKATYPDGSPASGTLIRWTTSRGNLSSTTSTTNSRGETSVRLTSTSSGNATVRATVPSGQNVSTTVGFKAPVLHSLARNKAEIDSNNSDRATLTATLRYMPENVAAKGGHAVQWSTNRGTLDHNATATNASGIAANRIRSNTEGSITVTASYGGSSRTVSLTAANQIEQPAISGWQRGGWANTRNTATNTQYPYTSLLNRSIIWYGFIRTSRNSTYTSSSSTVFRKGSTTCYFEGAVRERVSGAATIVFSCNNDIKPKSVTINGSHTFSLRTITRNGRYYYHHTCGGCALRAAVAAHGSWMRKYLSYRVNY